MLIDPYNMGKFNLCLNIVHNLSYDDNVVLNETVCCTHGELNHNMAITYPLEQWKDGSWIVSNGIIIYKNLNCQVIKLA